MYLAVHAGAHQIEKAADQDVENPSEWEGEGAMVGLTDDDPLGGLLVYCVARV